MIMLSRLRFPEMFHADIFSSMWSQKSFFLRSSQADIWFWLNLCATLIVQFPFLFFISPDVQLLILIFLSTFRFCPFLFLLLLCVIAYSSIVWFSIFLFRAEFLTWQKGSGGCLTKSSIDSQKNLADNLCLYILWIQIWSNQK